MSRGIARTATTKTFVAFIAVLAAGCASRPAASSPEPAPSLSTEPTKAEPAEGPPAAQTSARSPDPMHERAPATNDDAPIDATFLEEEVFDEGLLDDIASQSRINTEPAATPRATLREVFPGIRVDAEAGIVEFDGVVPIDTRNERAPDVYLEVIVCAPDSKEHEALVMADVRASHLHAALLLLGAEPGAPGRWSRADAKLRAEPPTGRRVRVELIAEGALPVPPSAWMRPEFGGSAPPETAWVFAGSLVADRDQDGLDEYAADRTGLLVGLHSFGSEVVAWTHMAHPDSSVETPAWLANNDVMPAAGEPVTIRLTLD